jgi:16S rRNA (adenine1518-N6/adenine1519-N6)-dimethyltransferase
MGFADVIRDQHFMLQKEVVQRMVAQPCTGEYGRLSVMLQWRYSMENLLHIPPSAFDPSPKVDSAFVRMQVRCDPQDADVSLLSTVVRIAFSQRRKLLRHTLGKWLEEQRTEVKFDCQRRAEEVSVSDYLQLVQSLSASTAKPIEL